MASAKDILMETLWDTRTVLQKEQMKSSGLDLVQKKEPEMDF